MLANVYQTKVGQDFISNLEPSRSLIHFCEFSLDSCNPKVVFTAGVVLFNHVLTYKGDLATLTNELYSAVMKIVEYLPTVTDTEAVSALLLAATRSLYKN